MQPTRLSERRRRAHKEGVTNCLVVFVFLVVISISGDINQKGSREGLNRSNFSEPPASANSAPTYAGIENRRKLLWCTWGLGGVFLLISALIACINLNARAPEGFGVF